MKLRIAIVTTIVLCTSLSTASASEEALRAAREAFDKAQTLFEAEKYKEAAEWFDKAYTAKNFPQFLFNIGACNERMNDWQAAVDYYNRYLAEEPTAKDKDALKKRIEVLKREAKRVKEVEVTPPEGTDPNGEKPPVEAAAPSEEVKNLSKVSVRGLVAITSDPEGAAIYFTDRKGKPLQTPWNGTLEGEHKVVIEKKGYESREDTIFGSPERFSYYFFGLTKQDYLGWVDITSNIPEAEIYVDNREGGVYQRTPYSGNLRPGKHTIWIAKDGYEEQKTEIEIIQGQTHSINAELKGSPVGYLNFRGPGIEYAKIVVDGQLLCERGPCRKPINEGPHTVEVKREDHKTFGRRVDIQAKTETTIRANLVEKPFRSDAVIAYVFSAVFIGAGAYALAVNGDPQFCDKRTLPTDDANGCEKGHLYGGLAGLGLGGIVLGTAVYYTFRDKGPPSTGKIDVKTLTVAPAVSPTYAGLGLLKRF